MDNDVAKVIDRTNLIENLLNQIIENFISPRKEIFSFFWNKFLDSSIIPIGTKVKLVKMISHEIGQKKLDFEPIYGLIKLRNAFAHHSLHSHPKLNVEKASGEDKSSFMLQTFNSDLKVRMKTRETALKEYNEKFDSAKDTLVELRNAVVKHLNGDGEKT